MLAAVEQTAAQTLTTVTDIKTALLDYKHRIRAAYRFCSQDLINNLFMHPYTKIEFVERDLKVSRLTATKYLDALADRPVSWGDCACPAALQGGRAGAADGIGAMPTRSTRSRVEFWTAAGHPRCGEALGIQQRSCRRRWARQRSLPSDTPTVTRRRPRGGGHTSAGSSHGD
jgi:hypothetical protein